MVSSSVHSAGGCFVRSSVDTTTHCTSSKFRSAGAQTSVVRATFTLRPTTHVGRTAATGGLGRFRTLIPDKPKRSQRPRPLTLEEQLAALQELESSDSEDDKYEFLAFDTELRARRDSHRCASSSNRAATELIFTLERRGSGWGEEIFPHLKVEQREITQRVRNRSSQPDPWEVWELAVLRSFVAASA